MRGVCDSENVSCQFCISLHPTPKSPFPIPPIGTSSDIRFWMSWDNRMTRFSILFYRSDASGALSYPICDTFLRRKTKLRMTYRITVAIFSLGLLLAPGNAQEKTKEKIGDVRALYDGKLFPDIQVNTFRHIDQLFSTRKIARGKSVYPLPRSSS